MFKSIKSISSVVVLGLAIYACKSSDPAPTTTTTKTTVKFSSTTSGVAIKGATSRTSTAGTKLNSVTPPTSVQTVTGKSASIPSTSGSRSPKGKITQTSTNTNKSRLTSGKTTTAPVIVKAVRSSATTQTIVFYVEDLYKYDTLSKQYKDAGADFPYTAFTFGDDNEYYSIEFTDSTYSTIKTATVGEYAADEDGVFYSFTDVFTYVANASGEVQAGTDGLPTGTGSLNILKSDGSLNEAEAIKHTSYYYVDFSSFDTTKEVFMYGVDSQGNYYYIKLQGYVEETTTSDSLARK